MTAIDIETKRKLHEIGATALLDAVEAQDEDHVLGMSFEDRLQNLVDEAPSTFNQAKVEGQIRGPGSVIPA